MPKRAVRFIFTEAQAERIHSFFPEFAAKVEECDPKYEGRNGKVTKWKKDKATALLNEPLFADLDAAESSEAWQNAIIRIYGNYFNASIKKGKPKLATKTGPNTRGLVLFSGKISPKALFALEHHDEITTLYKSICKEKGIPGGPAKSEATTQLWEQEDHEVWEQKAEDFANDVDANRGEFHDVIQSSMQDMLNTGALGSCILSLSYGYRRGDDNSIIIGRVQASFDAGSGSPLTAVCGDEFDEGEDSRQRWFDYARKTLPRKPLDIITCITRNDNGLPLFPIFSWKTRTYGEISQILDDFFLALWEHTQDGSIHIPWDDIAVHPDSYYDTWDHCFPCKLTSPQNMDEIELTQMAIYLANKPTLNPFTFYSKPEVDRNLLRKKHMNEASPPQSPAQQPIPSSPKPSERSIPPPKPISETSPSKRATPKSAAPKSVTHMSGMSPSATIPHTPSTPGHPEPSTMHTSKTSPSKRATPKPAAPKSITHMSGVSPLATSQRIPSTPSHPKPLTTHLTGPFATTHQHLSSLSRPSTPAVVSALVDDRSIHDQVASSSFTHQPSRTSSHRRPPTPSPVSSMPETELVDAQQPYLSSPIPQLSATPLRPPIESLPAMTASPSQATDLHTVATVSSAVMSGNIEGVGEKRKRKRPAKASVTTAESDAVTEPTGSSRRSARSCKQALMGPVLVVDPTLPPPKRVKHSFELQPIIE